MPRLFELGEHYDNHQAEITEAFERRGLVQCVRDEKDLLSAIERARAMAPVGATTEPDELIKWLGDRIEAWQTRRPAHQAGA